MYRIHWSIPDPGVGGGSDADTYPAFRAVAADLRISDTTASAKEMEP